MDLKYLAGVLKYVISTICSVGLVVFLMYHIIGSLTSDVDTATISFTTQEQASEYDAYIFRGESLLYTSPGDVGNINFLLEDGTKVSVGEEVCQVYAGSTSTESGIALAESNGSWSCCAIPIWMKTSIIPIPSSSIPQSTTPITHCLPVWQTERQDTQWRNRMN